MGASWCGLRVGVWGFGAYVVGAALDLGVLGFRDQGLGFSICLAFTVQISHMQGDRAGGVKQHNGPVLFPIQIIQTRNIGLP